MELEGVTVIALFIPNMKAWVLWACFQLQGKSKNAGQSSESQHNTERRGVEILNAV